MTFIATALLLYLAQASQTSVLQFSIADLQTEHARLVAQNSSLQSTSTALRSLGRVDQAASTQLHMAKADISTAIWVSPVVPRAYTLPPAGAEAALAGQQSRPLAWIERVFTLIRSSL